MTTSWSSPMRLHAGTLTVEKIANGYLLGGLANGVREKAYFADLPALSLAIGDALENPPPGELKLDKLPNRQVRT